jgi:hypothetical protein
VKAIRESADSETGRPTTVPPVVWETKMVWSLKDFNEDNWKKEVSSAGLQILSVKEGLIQRWYFLKHIQV